MSKHQVPEVADIDLDYTPASYFTERDPHLTLPSDILGKARPDIARQLVAEGEDPPPEFLSVRSPTTTALPLAEFTRCSWAGSTCRP